MLSEKEESCLQYFQTSDYVMDRKRIPARGPGTCAWFSEQADYKNWLSGQDSVALWISGGTGCGKTILSSYIIDELSTVGFRSRVPSTTCYFFCDTNNEKEDTGEAVLQGILHQIFTAHPFLLQKHALPYYQSMGSRLFLSFGTLCDIFEKICFDRNTGNIFCVIDGFDECEKSSRKHLIRLFKRIIEAKRTRKSSGAQFLKVLMMGRPEETVHTSFQGLKYASIIQLDNHIPEITKDIGEVVHAEVGKLQHLWSERSDMRPMIESTLIARANGSFLWVSLVLEVLREPPETSEDDLEKQLESLPGTLEGIYGTILEAIPSRRQKMASRILTFLVATARPLRLWEIGVALAVEADDQQIVSVIRRIPTDVKRSLRLHCGPLVKIVGETVHLVHRSAKDFLQDAASFTLLKPDTSAYRIEPVTANYSIATTCVRYISMLRPMDVFEESNGAARNNQSPEMKSEKALALSGGAFLPYAATYWANHLRQIGYINDFNLLELVRILCDEKMPFRLKWLKLCLPDSTSASLRMAESWRTNPQTLPTIMILSRFGLDSVVQELLKAGKLDILSQDIHGYTGLHWAAHEGHDRMVEFLLQNGVDPKIHDRDGNTALHIGAFSGQEPIINLMLLAKGSEIEAQNDLGWTPLHVAAYAGHEAVVKALIRAGSDIEAKDKQARTPLHVAAFAGHLTIIDMLLENGCFRHARDFESETALHYAARQGRDPIIKGLIQDKNDRKSQGKLGQTALHAAAEAGRVTSITVLLQKRLEIEARDNQFRTALHLAAQAGKDAVVQALLENKCDKNPRDEDGSTPLHLAAQAGNETTVEILLRAGCDCEVRDNQERTPMRLAAYNGNAAIIRALLDHGCHGNSLEGQEQTAIHISAELGHDFILEAILQNGCQKIDFRDDRGWTPLLAATHAGKEAAMEVLLHYNCNPNARDNLGDTALHIVARAGNESAVRVLLDGGCDRNARDSRERTALHIAAHEGHDNVVKLLLSEEYEREARDEFGWTALHLAVLAGHHSIIETLLRNGCSGSTRSSDGDTALHMAAKGGDGSAIKALLESGGDLEENIKRITIHVASQVVHDFSIRVLLENGCNGNSRDKVGWTALHYVARDGRDHPIRAILEHGGDPNIQTEDGGHTAMHHAAGAGHLSSVKLLCENGGNPKIRDKKGLNVPEYAAVEKKLDIVEYFQSISNHAPTIPVIVSDDADDFVTITEVPDGGESVDGSMGPTEDSHDIIARTPAMGVKAVPVESRLDSSVLTSTEDSRDTITRTSVTSGTTGPSGQVESTGGTWPPPPPTITDRPTSSGDSSGTNTTYQQHEDDAAETTDGLMGVSDLMPVTPATDRRRTISSPEPLTSPTYTDIAGDESPLSSVRHGSVRGTRGFERAGSPSDVRKAKGSRWPAWCLCGKKVDDGEEPIPARQSPSIR